MISALTSLLQTKLAAELATLGGIIALMFAVPAIISVLIKVIRFSVDRLTTLFRWTAKLRAVGIAREFRRVERMHLSFRHYVRAAVKDVTFCSFALASGLVVLSLNFLPLFKRERLPFSPSWMTFMALIVFYFEVYKVVTRHIKLQHFGEYRQFTFKRLTKQLKRLNIVDKAAEQWCTENMQSSRHRPVSPVFRFFL